MIRDKNVVNMLLFLFVLFLINSVVWIIYGILVEDVFVIVSNVFNVDILNVFF